MITLAQLMRNHQAEFIKKHRSVMQPRHYQAMNSIMDCHTPKCGEVQYHCSPCAELVEVSRDIYSKTVYLALNFRLIIPTELFWTANIQRNLIF